MENSQTLPRPWWRRLNDAFWSTRFGTWIILNIGSRSDPLLLRLSGGRLSSGTWAGKPVMLLTTTGAQSGKPRSVAVMYIADGNNLAIIGSRGGMLRHPGWVHNLRANPVAHVLLGKRSGTYITREASGPERERLWQRARQIYSGFDVYERRAGDRQIPVIVLTPQQDDPASAR